MQVCHGAALASWRGHFFIAESIAAAEQQEDQLIERPVVDGIERKFASCSKNYVKGKLVCQSPNQSSVSWNCNV
jgi:hypothetical protein